MNIELFFNKMVDELKLGELISKPVRVNGGLTHKMYKIETDKGTYIVKLLNPNIMKRPTALDNYKEADEFEELFKKNGVDAIYSLEFNGKKMQLLDGQYYYVYNWYNGKALKDNEIKKIHCEKIGKQLADIHNITLKEEKWIEKEKNIDWKYYIDLSKEKSSPIYEFIYDKNDLLYEFMNKGNEVINKLPNYTAICHNDLDCKNVLWIGEDFKIIDLECLGYSNPYLELFSLALYWSGYESCNINLELFKVFIDSYFDNSKLSKKINWEVLYYANNEIIEWLEYNIKRALMLETDSEEEKQLGINEVKKAINTIVYYASIKDELLEMFK